MKAMLSYALALCALPALAADPASVWPQWLQLSHEEAAGSTPVAANFENADLNGDGRLAPLEFNSIQSPEEHP